MRLSAKVKVMADGCTVYLTLIKALYQGGICLVLQILEAILPLSNRIMPYLVIVKSS